jgi:hypothetical protein
MCKVKWPSPPWAEHGGAHHSPLSDTTSWAGAVASGPGREIDSTLRAEVTGGPHEGTKALFKPGDKEFLIQAPGSNNPRVMSLEN